MQFVLFFFVFLRILISVVFGLILLIIKFHMRWLPYLELR